MKELLFVPILLAAPLWAQAPPAPSATPTPLRAPMVSGAPLSADQEKEALEFLLTDAAERKSAEQQMRNTKTRSPEVYWAHLRSALLHKDQVAQLKSEDAQRYDLYQREQQLHRKVDALAGTYRSAKTDAARDKARSDLKAALSDLFDVREQGALAAEVARLQREIKQQQDRNAQRRNQKDQIVNEELRMFTAPPVAD